jgi:hypothetical protein
MPLQTNKGVRCSNCSRYHADARAVRDCYQADYQAQIEHIEDKARNEELMAADRLNALDPNQESRDYASKAQVKYASDLLAERVWPDRITEDDLRGMERRQVSKLIDGLLTAPFKALSESNRPSDVPPGRYALETDGIIRFYQVDCPERGKWAGRTFVNRLIGSPGDYRKQPVRGAGGASVLAQIADDVKGAMLLFGKETMTCGACSSPLTNEESRTLGIGPVCRSKREW